MQQTPGLTGLGCFVESSSVAGEETRLSPSQECRVDDLSEDAVQTVLVRKKTSILA